MDDWGVGGLVGKWMDGIRRRARRPDKEEEVKDVVLSRSSWKCQKMSADHSNSNSRQWFLRRESS